MKSCARCDWQLDSESDEPRRTQVAGHAEQAGHPLCCVCGRSLTPDETQTCERCLTSARETLSGVVTMWTELPRHLGVLVGQGLDRQRGGGDEHQLPGGTILALLAPGSAGGRSRFGEDYEPDPTLRPARWWVLGQYGPLTHQEWLQAERIRYGNEHAADNQPTDAPSVAWVLTSWEGAWRAARGDAEPDLHRSTSAVVRAASRYLEVHARWAANNEESFSEFVDDLRELHLRLEQATGRRRTPAKAGADCFDCGGQLVRELDEHGLEEDHVTCQRCRRTYDQARYLLALAARREEGLRGWVTYQAAAAAAGRPVATLWSWVQRLQVTATCRLPDRAVLVWYPEVHDKATRPTRRRSA